ncbi:unnamed protein product [Lathyrus sativus]|nr:unnamed protein product [Lathyrus sativus]
MLKSQRVQKQILSLVNNDGTVLTSQRGIEEKILNFFGNLVGKASPRLKGIDIMVLRRGNQLSLEEMESMIVPISNMDIDKAL